MAHRCIATAICSTTSRPSVGDRSNPAGKRRIFSYGHLTDAALAISPFPSHPQSRSQRGHSGHPSNASLQYFYDDNTATGGTFKLTTANDRPAISAIREEFAEALERTLMMSCNPPLLILRVLHKFGTHRKLDALKKLHWPGIRGWSKDRREIRLARHQ